MIQIHTPSHTPLFYDTSGLCAPPLTTSNTQTRPLQVDAMPSFWWSIGWFGNAAQKRPDRKKLFRVPNNKMKDRRDGRVSAGHDHVGPTHRTNGTDTHAVKGVLRSSNQYHKYLSHPTPKPVVKSRWKRNPWAAPTASAHAHSCGCGNVAFFCFFRLGPSKKNKRRPSDSTSCKEKTATGRGGMVRRAPVVPLVGGGITICLSGKSKRAIRRRRLCVCVCV